MIAGGAGVQRAWARETKALSRGGVQAGSHPARLVHAVLRGLRTQLDDDRLSVSMLDDVCLRAGGAAPSEPAAPAGALMDGGYWDDVRGGWLPSSLVQEARREELSWLHEMGVYRKVPMTEAREQTGRPPITLR